MLIKLVLNQESAKERKHAGIVVALIRIRKRRVQQQAKRATRVDGTIISLVLIGDASFCISRR